MKIRNRLLEFDRQSFMHKDEINKIYTEKSFTDLNCRGGQRYLGFPKRVLELIEKIEWPKVMMEVGDTYYGALKNEICKYWSNFAELQPDNIKIGHGSMQVLERINKIILENGVKVLGCAPQFVEYATEALQCGAQYNGVALLPEEYFKFNIERFINEINSEYSLIYLDNPNNPTGQVISLEAIEKVAWKAKKLGIIFLVDEAYADYTGNYNSAINLINQYENIIVTRTFDKGFQFSGIRVGYGIFSPQVSAYYDKVDLPFAIPAVGSYLAKEALLDLDFITNVREKIKSQKEKLIIGLKDRGYIISQTDISCPIFLLGSKDETCDLKSDLLTKGILTISGSDFMKLGKNYVRVTVPEYAEELLDRIAQ